MGTRKHGERTVEYRGGSREISLARVTHWLAVRHSLRTELVLVLGLYALYEATRGLAAGSRSLAIRHADDVVSIERSLHLYVETSVQRSAEHVSVLVSTLGLAYLTLHLAVTGLLLIWLHQRRPAAYPFVRTTLLLGSGLAVIGYLVFPTAPPRLSGLGLVDTVSGHLPVKLNGGLVSSLYNPYAAGRACTPATPSSSAPPFSARDATSSPAYQAPPTPPSSCS